MEQRLLLENIDLLAKQAVEGFIIGLHKSPYHGFSVEFAEHKLYNQGDNLKHIDWKVFGRSERLFIKKFEEETNLRCHLVIDTSSSMLFPEEGTKYNKLQFSAISAAAIMHMLRKQQDATGLILFDEQVHFSTECKSNGAHYNNVQSELENLLNYKKRSTSTNAAELLHQIAESSKRRRLIILFSDMLDRVGDTTAIVEALQHMRYNKHEVIVFHVMDKQRELDFNFENRPYEFVDMETGETVRMTSTSVKDLYSKKMGEQVQYLKDQCISSGIDLIYADINQSFDQVLLPYFLKRSKMF